MGDYIVEREFEHAGYKCVVTFGDMGHRCGYVGIPKEHPLYGKNYSDYLDIKKEDIEGREVSGIIPLFCACLDKDERVKIDVYFQCHGGITYSGGGEQSEYPIASDLWRFGFDCAHAGDGKDFYTLMEKFPQNQDYIRQMMRYQIRGETVRSLEYVADECKNLAEQLKEFEKED